MAKSIDLRSDLKSEGSEECAGKVSKSLVNLFCFVFFNKTVEMMPIIVEK